MDLNGHEDQQKSRGFKLEPFKLERFFAEHEFTATHQLCCSDCEPLRMSDYDPAELLELASPQGLELWREACLAYTDVQGLPELRAQILQLYEQACPGDSDAAQVKVTEIAVMAPEEAIFLTMLALLSSGDHVICTFPGYQSLYQVAESSGCSVDHWEVRQTEAGLLRFDPADLKRLITVETKLVVVNFPHNPTGALLSRAEWEEVVKLCRDNGAYLFSDEMYRLLEADPVSRLPSGVESYEKAITLSGLSKAWGLPGLRVGWVASHDASVLSQVLELRDYTTICNSALSEIAAFMAVEATDAIVGRHRATIAENVKLANEFFARHQSKFQWHPPQAGSIAFPRLLTGEPVDQYCARLLKATGVLLLPATLYDHRTSIEGGHFRLGLGRRNFAECMGKWEEFIRSDH